MKRIYLFGYPLGHSISPTMQNAALAACDLDNWVYEKIALPPEKMKEMITSLRAQDCVGANVTIPYKQSIIPFLDELSSTAKDIGAVNTIVKRDGKLIGENTDAMGFLLPLLKRNINLHNARVFVLGAGGAASAVTFALAKENIGHLTIANRTVARAVKLADGLYKMFPQLEIAVNEWESLDNANIVINASAIGMMPYVEDSPLAENRTVPSEATVVDLVYNPLVTKFLKDAEKAKAKCIGGLEMLIYQGVLSFNLWTGQNAPFDVMQNVARCALEIHPNTKSSGAQK
jgi:shikimate dehydrogenase